MVKYPKSYKGAPRNSEKRFTLNNCNKNQKWITTKIRKCQGIQKMFQ